MDNTPNSSHKWILLVIPFIVLFSIFLYFFRILSSTSPIPVPERVAGQIIVQFKQGVSGAAIAEGLERYGANILSRNEAIGATVVKVPEGKEDEIIANLMKDGLVEYAESDYIVSTQFIPNDPAINQQWGLDKIHAPEAWDITKGAGIKVAVLDTGIDTSHSEFSSKVVAQNDLTGSGSIQDGNGHGTHVAGIVAANTNNATGIAGVCPDCQLMIGKVLGSDGKGPVSDVVEGVTWAADTGANLINMSLALEANVTSRSLENAVTYAWGKGVILVSAAGNTSRSDPAYPAAYPNVVGVAATDNNDAKASFTAYGTWAQMAAPGAVIYSTVPGGYRNQSGSSMAAPHVSGVLALILSTPFGQTPAAAVKRLCDTADKIQGTGSYWKCGRVNALAAVKDAASPTPPPLSPTAQVTVTVTPGMSMAPSISTAPALSPNPANPTTPITPTYVIIAPCPSCPTPTMPVGSSPAPSSGAVASLTPPTSHPQLSPTYNPMSTPQPSQTMPGGPDTGNTIPDKTKSILDKLGSLKKPQTKKLKRQGQLMKWLLELFRMILEFIRSLFGGQ